MDEKLCGKKTRETRIRIIGTEKKAQISIPSIQNLIFKKEFDFSALIIAVYFILNH